MRPRQVCRGKARPGPERAGEAGRRFNEAPASLPGKAPGRRLPAPTTARAASMRPRQVCRGKPDRRPERHPGRDAGFNEAPASLPGKGRAGVRRGGPLGGASMRPRQVCRGKLAPRVGAVHAPPASMRPRQVCRGKSPGPTIGPTGWSCFNEAPASLPGKAIRATNPAVVDTSLQ